MKYLSEEQQKKYPTLVYMARQCQSYVARTYGGCTGCGQMVSGCEKQVVAGLIKAQEQKT